MKMILSATVILMVIALTAACAPKHGAGGREAVKRPKWSDAEARKAIETLAADYRVKGDAFLNERAYVWAGTWVWPETVGIGPKNLSLLKEMFYKGDDATKEIVLKVIFMNIPSKTLEKGNKTFMTDLVKLDTDLKERRANIPPPTPNTEIIEEYVPVPR